MSLNRAEIKKYIKSSSQQEKQIIEKKSLIHDFDSDSLDGWTEYPKATMRRLDRKFGPNGKIVWVSISISIAVILAVIITLSIEKSPVNSSTKSNTSALKLNKNLKKIEKTDLITPPEIEKLKELPKKEQIAIKNIIADFQNLEEKAEENTPISIEPISPEPYKVEDQVSEKIITNSYSGKELFLYDLKVIDYRAYRSKPEVNTKQVILTGTPAKEGESSRAEDMEWENIEIPYIEYLSKTMEQFSKGQNKKALARFLTILETYPDDINANFYGGLCYYNLNSYNEAEKCFKKCSISEFINFREEANWYLAKSLIANDKKEEALNVLRSIVEENGFYAKQAAKLLR